MLKQELLKDSGILIIEPETKLQQQDFANLNTTVDPYVEQNGKLNGIMIYTQSFPFWEDFNAFLSHMRFVRDHHKQVAKVALVSDSKVLSAAPTLGNHFVAAQIKHFPYADKAAAMTWLTTPENSNSHNGETNSH